MTASRSSRRAFVLGSSMLAVLAGAGLASAGPLAASAPVQVPDHPLAGACSALVAQQTAAGSVNYPGAEVEPHVAADPADPAHLVGSFQQDRWNDGGSNGLTNVVSRNGGATWTLAASQPAFSRCAGAAPGSPGYFMRSTDPWVSFSADGKVVYSIADSFDTGGPAFGGASSIMISRSLDGGDHWQTPVTARLDRSDTVLNDKESVTADPFKASSAYAVWDQLVSPQSHANPDAFLHSIAYRGPSYFSSTADQGATWSTGRIIYDPGQNDQTIGNQIVVPTTGPAKGVLIDGFNLITNKGGKCLYTHGGQHCAGNSTSTAALVRSTDGGATWSDAIGIDVQQVAPVSIAGHPVRSSDDLPEFAANPVTGAIYAVWQDGRFANGTSKIAFAQSTDGGLTWSTTIRADQSPGGTPAFVPQIQVSADGTVGLTYYDLQNATAAQPGLADAYVVHCHATTTDCTNPASWTAGGQTRLSSTGSFDYTTAPDAGGYFLGDYTGLARRGTSFTPFYGMSQPIATAGRSDIFSNSVH
ncbi:sialidase family protein [Amycolatopsis echigonensis]|uniref:Exo-alpha-sialidase n=1 Tax=Amycolatopsis echigonensis TaxID=2576905 RepID=A0A8E2B447_9PSEU|nr:sialidase family protein [Amycolatopsis echigonensis]MBB2500565.1 exo-alpha-sialidase [Amycolatopsis echigonensis]